MSEELAAEYGFHRGSRKMDFSYKMLALACKPETMSY